MRSRLPASFPARLSRRFCKVRSVSPSFRWPTAEPCAGRRRCEFAGAWRHTISGVTLCLGGVVLSSLPVILAGSPAQRASFFADLRAGHVSGLGLSEWRHGSDLLHNETVAEPVDEHGHPCAADAASHFRLRGIKRPINNASRGMNLVVLARTGAADDAFGSTLFLLRRGLEGLASAQPVDWMGYPGMDLNSIVLDDVVVPRSACLGKVGEGFVHTRATLAVSRSGVAAMAVGASAAAFAEALAHARDRQLYGASIDSLGGVRRLLARSFSRVCVAAALSRQAAHAASWAPRSARGLTCASKYLCPQLLEDNIRDCGTVLGARSLTGDRGFTRLRRDAPILAIFDGSSQLQLDELWRSVSTWSGDDRAAEAYARCREAAPMDLGDNGADDRVAGWTPLAILSAVANDVPWLRPFAECSRVLAEASRNARAWSQGKRFLLSEAAATLAGMAALAEAAAQSSDGDSLRAALRLFGAQVSAELGTAMHAFGGPKIDPVAAELDEDALVDDVLRSCLAMLDRE